MATEYKTPFMSQAEIEGDKMVRDIVRTLNLLSDQVRVTSYDHCKTLEELEFEIYSNLLKDGTPKKIAKEFAMAKAKDLWDDSEALK